MEKGMKGEKDEERDGGMEGGMKEYRGRGVERGWRGGGKERECVCVSVCTQMSRYHTSY